MDVFRIKFSFELNFDVTRNKRRHTQHDAKHTTRATARVEREAPESNDTATSLSETRESNLLKGNGV